MCAAQEFDPAEFYDLMEAAEWRAREVVQVDVPQYILRKLGLADATPSDSRTHIRECTRTVYVIIMYSQCIKLLFVRIACENVSYLRLTKSSALM